METMFGQNGVFEGKKDPAETFLYQLGMKLWQLKITLQEKLMPGEPLGCELGTSLETKCS